MLIGLTGGIGAGKTTVARALAERGATILDADQIAREVVEPGTPTLIKLAETFGSDILNSDGSLNRAKLGELVFGNADHVELLNSIVHPAVRERTQQHFDTAGERDVLVYDVPLLIEAQLPYAFDLIVVAMAPESVRLDRLVNIRGMSPAEAQSRIDAQATDDQRREIADVLIDTGGSMEETYEQVEALWKSKIEPWIQSA